MKHSQADISHPGELESQLRSIQPTVVINAAAAADVDFCEEDPQLAAKINCRGAGNAARAAANLGALIVHVSTDAVFDGNKPAPYRPEDSPNPVNIYGRSKREGELLVGESNPDHIIVRASKLFGPGHKDLVGKILASNAVGAVEVICDQRASFTYTRHFSQGILKLISKRARGIFHLANDGSCGWMEFTRKVLELAGRDKASFRPVPLRSLRRPAFRPRNCSLDSSLAYDVMGYNLPTWQEALEEYMTVTD